jgi:RNA-binding protein YlmH
VQSLRLDSVASGIFNESREKMNLNIRDGIVMLNYLVCQNTSQAIKEGDIISIKGFGKAVILEIGGLTRRGKTFVVAGRYV